MVIKKNTNLPDYQSFVDYSSAIGKNKPVPKINDVIDRSKVITNNKLVPQPNTDDGNSKVISNKKPLPSPQNNSGQVAEISSFQKVFVENDWQEDISNNRFVYNIAGNEHNKGSNAIYDIYELTSDGLKSVILEDFLIDSNSNITLVSAVAFDGKIVIK